MKPILFIVMLLTSLCSTAQKKPSQAEINKPRQAQVKAQKEMNEELKELEEDDPEMAKQMREMMKQQGKPVKSTTVVPPPKYISPITPIIVKQPVTPPTEGQAKDRLLWYKGKKINDTLLITATGTLVLYKPKKNEVVVQPETKQDPFLKIEKELANTENRKTDFINYIAPKKNSFFYYPSIIGTLKEFENTAASYSQVLKNTIPLPPVIDVKASAIYPQKWRTGGTASFIKTIVLSSIPAAIKNIHDEALAKMKNYPPIDFPPPPAQDFSICYDCDSAVSKAYLKEYNEWLQEFMGYEKELTDKAHSVTRTLDLLNLDKETEAIQMNANMDKVNEFAMNRFRNKVELLKRKYGNDFTRLPIVVQMALSYERQKQLLGAGDTETYAKTMNEIKDMLDKFDTYIDEQMKEKNYNVALNLPLIIGMERQKQLLGASGDNNWVYFDKFMAFNRFRLSIDMDASSVSEDRIADAGAKTTNDVYMSLGFIKCRLQGFITSADYRKGAEYDFRIPMTAKGGIKKQKEEEDKWVSYDYSGPKDIQGFFPVFSISFCNDGHDSVFLQIPIHKYEDMKGSAEKLVTKAYNIEHLGVLAMLVWKNPDDEVAREGSEIAQQAIATYSANHIEKPTGNATLDKLQHEYNLAVKTKELQDKMSTAINQSSMLLLFDAQNKNEVIVDAETKPSHTIDEDSVKGRVKIKVVHDPAPYEAPKPVK